MSLSKRLSCVCSYVDEGAFIADVGSDHAQVPLFLLRSKRISQAQAIENKKGPFSIMAAAIADAGYSESCLSTLSDGLEKLDPSVDTLIVAGMGGGLIVSILRSHPEKLRSVKTIILDPHTELPLVREKVANLGYRLIDETFLFENGKPYDVMKWARSGETPHYSEEELYFGPINLQKRSADWLAYLLKRKGIIERICLSPTLPPSERQALLSKNSLIETQLKIGENLSDRK